MGMKGVETSTAQIPVCKPVAKQANVLARWTFLSKFTASKVLNEGLSI